MERHHKLGTIVMVLSVVLVLASLVFSDNVCYPDAPAAQSIWSWLSICMRLVVYEDVPGNEYADHLYIPAKFLVLSCALIFALGFLWYRGALPLPARSKRRPSSGGE